MSDAVLSFKTVVQELRILEVGPSAGHTESGAVENREELCLLCQRPELHPQLLPGQELRIVVRTAVAA